MKTYYDDDEASGDVYGRKVIVLPDQFGKGDFPVALLLGAVTFVLLTLFALPGLHPTLWNDLAIAAGLRPAAGIFPGLWRIVTGGLYSMLGVAGTNAVLPVIAKVLMAIDAFMLYFVFRGALAVIVRLRAHMTLWSAMLARLVSALGAFLFICSDPIWRAGQTFSSASLLCFLSILVVFGLVRFLMTGRLAPAYFAMLLLGVLCAETPFGFFLLIGFWTIYLVLLLNGHISYMETLQPFVKQVSKWYLTFVWVFGFLAMIAANVVNYTSLNGLDANGLLPADLAIEYISSLWGLFVSAASPAGWIIGLGTILMPAIVALVLVDRSTDEEVFLPYHVGVVFVVIAVFAYAQAASLQPLWFWTWIKTPEMVPSHFFQCIFSLINALTFVCALTVLAVDGYCRNHRRLAMQYMPESMPDEVAPRFFIRLTRRVALFVVPVLIIAGLVPGRIQTRTCEMLTIIRDYVAEVVREAGDAKFIFSDGSCDCAFELEAAAQGRKLRALSMIGKGSTRDVWIRQESLKDEEDRLSAAVGTPNLLRTWQRDKPDRLKECAIQLGFELWKRSGKTPPRASGLLARTEGVSDAEREEGIRRAYAITEHILEMYANGGTTPVAGPFVNDIFLFVQWRLARLARVRSEQFDNLGDTKRAMEENHVSDTLDDKNESLKAILEGMAHLRELTMRQMTPREGLQFALVRADFVLARRYAEPILDADPDDPNANFGMGMSYFMQEQFGRAETYLKRCLKKNAKEPAIWNNLAVLQLRQGRFDEAMDNAKKALALVPDSAEVKDTLRQITTARQAAATNTPAKATAPAAQTAKPAAKDASEPAAKKSEKKQRFGLALPKGI